MPTERIGNTVIKTYQPELRWQWGREVAFLERVKFSSNFPKPICYGDHSITFPWLGYDLANPETFGLRLERIDVNLAFILRDLARYGIRHRDITPHNLIWDPTTEWIRLIDFGWSVWNWESDTPIPLPEVMRSMDRPDREQGRDALKEIERIRAQQRAHIHV